MSDFAAYQFTYTLHDLQKLRDCMLCNDRLSAALTAFESLREWPNGFPWRQYLEFAEKILENEHWPEEHLASGGR